ncbi:MAG: outer membrane beta-barrel protein [Elusimicrobiaceae bacterium]|nr:outer membrane beta-barrel protein [Elusimicrobiaceae bacterium]
MKKLFLLGTLLFAFSAVSAQNYYPVNDYGLRAGTSRFELHGGMVLPQSSWNHNGQTVDLGNTGWTAGLGFYRSLTSVLTLGIDGNYAQFGDGDKMNEGTSNESYYRTGAATGLVVGRINFFPRHSTRLYIPVGVGVGHIFVRENKDDGSHQTFNSTDLAGMAGLGLEFDMDESWLLGVEGRYYYMRTRSDVKDAFGKGHMHYTEILLKIGFRF